MDQTRVEQAAAMAAVDGEWALNAACWSGSLTVECDGAGWVVAVEHGRPVVVSSAESASAAGEPGSHVTVSGPVEAWDRVLASPPPPGFTDFIAAAGMGMMTLTPPPADAAQHLAIRRFGDLLRHARNGSDPTPVVRPNRSRAGEHDVAVGRYVHLDLDDLDHRVYYESAGEGIGLLCQHTAGADGRQWRHLLEDQRVTSRFRVIVYDLPYHGKSLPPEGRAWWAEPYVLTKAFAMALPVALSAALGLDRPVFIGSSVGGMLALDLARYHPGDFRAVIALEGGLKVVLPEGLDDSTAELLSDPDPASHAATMMMIMSPTAPETYRQETRLHYAQGAPGVFAGDINYYSFDHDLTAEVDQIDVSKCAVHLLTGEYDFPTVPWTEEAARRLPGATCAIMPGLGHFPMSEDHDRLMEHVLPILDGIAESAG